MISVEMMVVMWTTKLEVLSDLKHLGSMEEPKGERAGGSACTGPQDQISNDAC